MICLFDPGIEDNRGTPSSNLGDLIIQRAVDRELRLLFPGAEVLRISTQTRMHRDEIRRARSCEQRFVGGTNLLSSRMRQYRQWEIGLLDAWKVRDAVLLGVGWWEYQERPDLYTRMVLRAALSSRHVHSVRDSYTEQKLRSIGMANVINTGCPTMWPPAGLDPRAVPTGKASAALLMLTDYRPEPELDLKLFTLLRERYDTVYCWAQGRADVDYIRKLGVQPVMLAHSLEALDALLKDGPPLDYVGTRLHGGVQCLLAGRRSLVIEVDNRAREIARDTGLPTVQRDDFDAIRRWIDGSPPLDLRINSAGVAEWRRQFTTS